MWRPMPAVTFTAIPGETKDLGKMVLHPASK
jgi:hypothetical protein